MKKIITMTNSQKKYIDWIKSGECLICWKPNPDPDHLEAIGMGGNRKKHTLKHFSCIPLCRLHHTERHSLGVTGFQERYGINLYKELFKKFREFVCQEILKDI